MILGACGSNVPIFNLNGSVNMVTTSQDRGDHLILLNAVTDGVLDVHLHAGSRPWT